MNSLWTIGFFQQKEKAAGSTKKHSKENLLYSNPPIEEDNEQESNKQQNVKESNHVLKNQTIYNHFLHIEQ